MNKLFYLLFGSAAVIIIGSLVIFSVESDNPDSQINSMLDAVWWNVATVTTVEYGDIVLNPAFGYTASTFSADYGNDLLQGQKITVLVKVLGEPESENPQKRAKEIRHLQSAVLKFCSFAGATNVRSDTWNNEFTATVTTSLAKVLEKRSDVISVTILEDVQKSIKNLDKLSPKKQQSHGRSIDEIQCKSDYVLMIRSLDSAACFTSATAEKLVERGWGTIQKEATKTMLSTQDAQRIAEQAFIYVYPLLENYRIMYGNMVDESSDEFLGSYNTLHDEEKLATPDDKGFVTPNADNLYTYVWFDLRAEPMVVTLPPIEEDRYYTFQNVDYFSNNYFYMGTATTGNDGGTFLIAGPNWSGEVPDGIDDSAQSTTEFNYVLERNQVKNNEDVPNANSIQKQFKIQSLSEFIGTAKPDSPPKIDFIPWNSEQGYSGDFVNYFNLILTWSEIPESEKSLFEEFSKIGIKPGETVDWTTIDPQIKNAINEGAKTGFDKIKGNIPNIGTVVGDWLILDAFGDAKYHENNFLRRASGVMLGQYGNSMQEAIYPAAHPSNGIPYDGQKNNYEIKFSSEPPVGAFWSLTVYDSTTQFLIDNPIDRYLINSSSDIQKNDDGSFVLYLQQEPPEDEKQSNWLPINDGSFYFGMRLYLPDQTIRDGLWEYPIIETIPK